MISDLPVGKSRRTPFLNAKVGHNVEHNVGKPLERMVNRSLSDGLFQRVVQHVQHAVRHVVRNVGRIDEQSLEEASVAAERNPERNVGQTHDRIVIDRRCEWEIGCSRSGWRPWIVSQKQRIGGGRWHRWLGCVCA